MKTISPGIYNGVIHEPAHMDATRSLSSQECLTQVPFSNLDTAGVYVTSQISIPRTETLYSYLGTFEYGDKETRKKIDLTAEGSVAEIHPPRWHDTSSPSLLVHYPTV